MTASKKFTVVWAAALAAAIAIVVVVALTVGGELLPPLKAWLKATFSHHWIGKGVLAAAVFLVLTFIGSLRSAVGEDRAAAGVRLLAWTLALGSLSLVLFFAYEAFFVHP